MGQQGGLPDGVQELLSRHNLLPKTRAEQIVLNAVISGEEANCGPANNKTISVENPNKWGDDQTVRGTFMQGLIVHLMTSRRELSSRINVSNARFTEQLDLSGLTLPALFLIFNHCRFDQILDASDSHLLSLDLSECWVPELYAAALAVDKHLVLTSLQCPSKIDLSGTHIEGSLYAERVLLGNAPLAPAGVKDIERGLDGLNLYVGGNVIFTGAKVTGPIYLYGGTIGGTLDFGGMQIDGLGGYTVNLEKTTIQGNTLMTAIEDNTGKSVPFSSKGCVGITNSTIKNGIDATGGHFALTKTADDIPAGLVVTFSSVQGRSKFAKGFEADGVSFEYSDFGVIDFHLGKIGPLGLNLRSTKAREFVDSTSAWPEKNLDIAGFTYDKITDETNAREAAALPEKLRNDEVTRRLHWIALGGSLPEAYKQYSTVLTNEGKDDDAKRVNEESQLESGKLGGFKKETETMMTWPIGYGYSPENAVGGLLILTALGWIIYRRNYNASRITPTECDAYDYFKKNQSPPPHYTRFSPLVYSLENTFPLVNLGQAAKWQPDPSMKLDDDLPASGSPTDAISGVHSRREYWSRQLLARRFTRQLRVFLWVQILIGWALATLFIAAIGGLIRK